MPDGENLSAAADAPLTRIPFTARDELSIRALCNWMQVAAVISFIGATFKLGSVFVPPHNLGNVIDAVITLLIGLWVFQAAAAFRKVVATDTADQRHLVEGFVLLRRVFLLQSILVIIVFTFLAIVLVVAAVVMATHR